MIFGILAKAKNSLMIFWFLAKAQKRLKTNLGNQSTIRIARQIHEPLLCARVLELLPTVILAGFFALVSRLVCGVDWA